MSPRELTRSCFNFTQSPLRYCHTFLLLILTFRGSIKESTKTISWSEIPGITFTCCTSVGLFVKNRSSLFSPLVGDKFIWLAGDFNMPDIDWSEVQVKADSKTKNFHNNFINFSRRCRYYYGNKKFKKKRKIYF